MPKRKNITELYTELYASAETTLTTNSNKVFLTRQTCVLIIKHQHLIFNVTGRSSYDEEDLLYICDIS